jgi:hypothetical protein
MIDEIEDIDEIEFEKEAALTRHKELKNALKDIASILKNPEKDAKVIAEAIKRQGDALERLALVIQNQPKPEKPQVNVELNQSELLPLLSELKNGNDRILIALQNKPMVDSFQVRPSGMNNAERTINVIYKPMNQITIK